jgi:hypothetical protein
VFHRLGSPSPWSVSTGITPGYRTSRGHAPSLSHFDATRSIASATRSSYATPALRRYGDAVRVSGQILENLFWPAEGTLGVYHPFHAAGPLTQCLEGHRVAEEMDIILTAPRSQPRRGGA